MERIYELLQDEVNEPTSDTDILKLVKGQANVIKVSDLDKYSGIDEILYPYDAAVLLWETKPNYGHWVALTKHDNLVEYFNSYGDLGKGGDYGMPDSELHFINKEFSKESGQDKKLLTKYLIDSDYDVSYNDHRFQKLDPEVSTCGRWAALRILLKDIDLATFKELFYGKYSDELVAFLGYTA